MSNLSTYPTPFQVVLKPGLYQSQNTKGGLNLNKWLLKFLKRIGFADTVDCCVYYPTYPILEVENIGNPTEQEMINVPLYSMFLCVDGDIYYLHFKYSAANTDTISTND